ncbi:MAG: rhodanese-related sulfurtransferase [Sphingobium sp.]
MQVAALYHFTTFKEPEKIRETLLPLCEALGIKGTLLVAGEGINGTISGEEHAVAALISHVRGLPGCADVDVKYSEASDHPFARMKVKVKDEIVTMGAGDLDPAVNAGVYVEPEDWNALISDPDTVLIDTRNDYEVAIGSFKGAIDPALRNFREFPDWFQVQGAQWRDEGRMPTKIAMFCTGGIRCEKSTAYARSLGFDQVYHLKGGILKYLEKIPKNNSLWNGNCFVFDERVSVGHGLELGSDQLCRACGWPVSEGERHDCEAGV